MRRSAPIITCCCIRARHPRSQVVRPGDLCDAVRRSSRAAAYGRDARAPRWCVQVIYATQCADHHVLLHTGATPALPGGAGSRTVPVRRERPTNDHSALRAHFQPWTVSCSTPAAPARMPPVCRCRAGSHAAGDHTPALQRAAWQE